MKTAIFLDFEDSFSYNVIQELIECGLEVDVIKWFEFNGSSRHDLLVLGPGPGHPDDYKLIFELIEKWLHSNKKIFAICLGHQIISRILGFEVSKSKFPTHGQKVQLELDEFWQNSRSSLFLSYQFHPESMGTKCRRAFFRPILTDLL